MLYALIPHEFWRLEVNSRVEYIKQLSTQLGNARTRDKTSRLQYELLEF